jgi:hypothetical protein
MKQQLIILFDVNTAIRLADPPGATLVILDNLGWYCDTSATYSIAHDRFK